MIIGIDGNEANIGDRVGVNVYAFEILRGIYKLQDEWKDKYRIIIYLKEIPLVDLPKENQFWSYKILSSQRRFWVLTKLMPYLLKTREKPYVLFSLSHYTVPIASIPRIISIMDLGYLNYSDQFKKGTFWQLKYWTAISIIASKRIIAISNDTKNSIVRHYPFATKKIVVTHLGYDKERFNLEILDDDVRRIKDKYSIVDDYILYIGTLKPSKNIEGLVRAFVEVKSKSSGIKLVIAGKKGWMFEDTFAKVRKFALEGSVIFTDFLPEEEKPALMKGAKMLVSPSFTEGFGLHALEAMACGTPVVVSNIGSFPEVVGKVGIIVDPYSAKSISDGILKVLNLKKNEYNRLSQKCAEWAKSFSWEATARKTLEIIEKTIN